MLSIAYIQTGNPQRIMNRLSRHWAHKLPVELAEHESRIELPMGNCRLFCTDLLRVELQAEQEQMPTLQQVVADHLLRMANPEALVIEWQQV
jgi:hypothetical protein